MRWLTIHRTSPSGKTLFVCLCCGRVSQTPDKQCPSVQNTTVVCFDWTIKGNLNEREKLALVNEIVVDDGPLSEAEIKADQEVAKRL